MEEAILSTFSWAIILGIFFVQLAHKIRVSAIVVLLVGGILAGPACLGIVQPQLLSTAILKTVVALAIGLILFEGGLTLDINDYRKVSKEIRGLLTVGVIVTWMGTTCCIHYIMGFSWEFSLLAASLVIVTGPTVVGPLLKRIHAKENISNILHWEGVLIDPIGVFISLLCYEWISSGGEQAIVLFLKRIVIGICCGSISGVVLAYFIKNSQQIKENLNGLVLASAIATFSISEHFAHESGLLAVIISGFLIGYLCKGLLDEVKAYKEKLIEMLIGLLFILLSANLDIKAFENYGYELVFVVLAIMLIVRPLNILFSTFGTSLTVKEKMFLSWIAPRGIVAASMASLFAISLKDNIYNASEAQFLETFTYSIIICTVLFQGLTAKFVGKSLGVLQEKPTAWLVIGSHRVARYIAKFLEEKGYHVIVMDNDIVDLRLAKKENLNTIYTNARFANAEDYPELYKIGNVLAITANDAFNILACRHLKNELHDIEVYACHAEDEQDVIISATNIWQKLPLRKLLTIEEDEKLNIVSHSVDIRNIKRPEQVLLCCYKDNVYPFVPQVEPAKEDEAEPQPCTIVRYTKKILANDLNLKENRVISSNAKTIMEAIKELLELLKIEIPELSIDNLIEHFEEQQRKYVSLFGYDIALFHSYSSNIESSITAIAYLEEPINLFGKKISIIFLVISSINEPQKHIEMLSALSRFILKPNNRKLLEEAKSNEDLLNIFF